MGFDPNQNLAGRQHDLRFGREWDRGYDRPAGRLVAARGFMMEQVLLWVSLTQIEASIFLGSPHQDHVSVIHSTHDVTTTRYHNHWPL
jgi:hypothetical protein